MPYINNNNIKIYYEVIGKGIPIVFHHGYGNCIEDWYELGYVDALKNNFQLILIDGRGFGKSSKPHDPYQYTFDLRTADTIIVIDQLNIKKAVAFGNSMGGKMVFALMHYYPQRFYCFIVGGMHPFGRTTVIAKTIQKWLKKGIAYTVDQLEKMGEPFPGNMRERQLKNDPQAMLAAYALPPQDLSAALTNIDMPVLLYAGSEDAVLTDMREAEKLLKNVKFCLLEKLSHSQTYWHSDLASELIKDFLNPLQFNDKQ